MSWFGQFAATSQFIIYGKRHFTKTGYEKHVRNYEQPDLLSQNLDLSEHVFIVTGGNSGVGKEVVQYLASKQATVYMICRSRERALQAHEEIATATGNSKVYALVGDVSLEADVRRCWQEFLDKSASTPRLDAVVCNAGALQNEKTLTSEGLEVTFASHLLFGTYLLGSLAMPVLRTTPGSRFIAVSSGGMYNTPFPSWEVATNTAGPSVKYDGQLAYAYAKRAQVLLCERWAVKEPNVKVVSCHPGWTLTPAVDLAYGDAKKYLEPMRSPWEGAEGMAWLCVAPSDKIESGEFYLDRLPRVKHISGPFFSEGSFTKNSVEQVDAMMRNLDDWANGRRPKDLAERAEVLAACTQAREAPLTAMERPIDLNKFMGKWYVQANIPTVFDKNTSNNIEQYTYDEAQQVINIDFFYSNKELTKTSCLKQRAYVKNVAKTEWALSPKFGLFLPLNIPYLIADCAEDYSSTIVGVPDRAYVWIMTRDPRPDSAVIEALKKKAQLLGYDLDALIDIPQDGQEGDPKVTFEGEDEDTAVPQSAEAAAGKGAGKGGYGGGS